MKNKYFKYLLVIVVVAFVVPQITLAAWYNPFSWNWNIISWFTKPTIVTPPPVSAPTNNIPITSNGINLNKLTVRYLDYTDDSNTANSKFSWQEGSVKFSISKVYLTPDIADIGNWRDNYGIGKDNIFIVVETFVKDDRTTGSNRANVDTGKSLRVTDSTGLVSAPADNSYLYLSPQENGKEFRVFIVNKNTKEITLRSGNTYQPQTTNINFFGSDAKTFTGVFLYKKGLANSYN